MARQKNECIDEARKALNHFTNDELEEYIRKVISETKALKARNVPFPREMAIQNMNNELLASMLEDSARSARDIGKWDAKKPKMDMGVKPKSFLDKTKVNTDDNIETASNASKQLLSNDGFGEMTKEHLDVLVDGKADDAIAAVASGKEHGDPIIKKLGKALDEYITKRNARLIRSDAMKPSEMSQDRFFRNSYDASKMVKMGKANWVQLHKSLINIEETFKHSRAMNLDGELDEAIVDEMIGNTYDNIVEGNGALFTKATTARDSDMIERTRRMFYKYKDWEAWQQGNKLYGQGSLMKAWLMDINTSSKQIGMAEVMGTQPLKMWNEMRHYQVAKSPPTSSEKAEMYFSDALFNYMLGANRGAYDPKLANFGESIRTIGGMARLGKLVLRSIPDISNVGAAAMRSGNGYWAPMLDSIVNAFNLLPSEDRKILAKQMSAVIDTHAGTVSRYVDVTGMGGALNKLSNKFFYYTALDAWDRGNKLSAMVPIMRGFGKASVQAFEKLNRQRQAYLRRFNISEHEWDALRSKTADRRFTLDNVDKMTDAEMRELWEKGDKVLPYSEYRGALYRKVFAMFDTAHEFAVLNPTAFSRMVTTFNTRAGTRPGEIVRSIMEFKGYPLQFMRRIVVGGMQDMDSYQGKFMYALNMALGTIMLTQLSDALNAISNGLTPPDPRKMSKGEAAKYYAKMMAGGAGIFGTILTNPKDLKTAGGQFIATPSLKLVADPFVAGLSLINGDLKGAKRAVKDWVNNANPIATTYITSPFVDAILGNKPYMEPGQQQLF